MDFEIKIMKNKISISLFYLVMISSAFVVSIRNLPMIAKTQMQMIFFGCFAALTFFIPSALVSAELSSGWPQMGGIAVWVREAFGRKWGFVASWLQWMYTIIAANAVLFFISSSFAFVFNSKWSDNILYLLVCEILLIWIFTIANLKGLKISKMINTVGFLSGVLFPAVFIIITAIFYVFVQKNIQMDISWKAKNLFPNFKDFSTLVLLISFIRAFCGVEAASAHADKVNNPKKNYPIAILIVFFLGLLVNILGAMSIAIVIPQDKISLVSGVMVAFSYFLNIFKLSFLIPVFGFLIAIGQISGFSAWITGPVKGILEIAKEGELPPFFQKVNKYDVPVNLILVQAIVISFVGSFFLLFFENINLAFWISVAFSMLIYVSMYFLMFLSALYLRYKKPEVERGFKIPFKHLGIWTTCCVGMLAMIFSFIIAFIPPSQVPSKHHYLHYSVLIFGIIIIYAIPFVINFYVKSSWKKQKN